MSKSFERFQDQIQKIILRHGASTEWFAYCLENDIDTFDEKACNIWQRSWNPVYEPWRFGDYHRWCTIAGRDPSDYRCVGQFRDLKAAGRLERYLRDPRLSSLASGIRTAYGTPEQYLIRCAHRSTRPDRPSVVSRYFRPRV